MPMLQRCEPFGSSRPNAGGRSTSSSHLQRECLISDSQALRHRGRKQPVITAARQSPTDQDTCLVPAFFADVVLTNYSLMRRRSCELTHTATVGASFAEHEHFRDRDKRTEGPGVDYADGADLCRPLGGDSGSSRAVCPPREEASL